MSDGTDFSDVLLGLPGFVVTAVIEDEEELLIGIEAIHAAAGCPSCGGIARPKDRLRVVLRDLPAFGRCVRLIRSKRRFFCPASLARWLDVCWATVMAAIRHHGTPLIDNPDRVGEVTSLGIDDAAF